MIQQKVLPKEKMVKPVGEVAAFLIAISDVFAERFKILT